MAKSILGVLISVFWVTTGIAQNEPNKEELYLIEFQSKPKSAKVFVDGELICETTPCQKRLKKGWVEIVMQAEWYFEQHKTIEIKKPETIDWQLPKKPRRQDVLWVASREVKFYDQVRKGFMDQFKGSVTVVHQLSWLDLPWLWQTLDEERPKLIVAVGIRAARMMGFWARHIPVVFCMVPADVQADMSLPNQIGVSIDSSMFEQMQVYKTVYPYLEKLGVVYDPYRTGYLVEKIMQSASYHGLEVIGKVVRASSKEHPKTEEELQAELDASYWQLSDQVDAILIIRDATTITHQSFKTLIEIQHQKKVPIFAYAKSFVEKGALLSASSDYLDHGVKVHEVVQKVLQGAQFKDIPQKSPQVRLFVNFKTARDLGVETPGAENVDEGIALVEFSKE